MTISQVYPSYDLSPWPLHPQLSSFTPKRVIHPVWDLLGLYPCQFNLFMPWQPHNSSDAARYQPLVGRMKPCSNRIILSKLCIHWVDDCEYTISSPLSCTFGIDSVCNRNHCETIRQWIRGKSSRLSIHRICRKISIHCSSAAQVLYVHCRQWLHKTCPAYVVLSCFCRQVFGRSPLHSLISLWLSHSRISSAHSSPAHSVHNSCDNSCK